MLTKIRPSDSAGRGNTSRPGPPPETWSGARQAGKDIRAWD
jgi:hypothetical protein